MTFKLASDFPPFQYKDYSLVVSQFWTSDIFLKNQHVSPSFSEIKKNSLTPRSVNLRRVEYLLRWVSLIEKNANKNRDISTSKSTQTIMFDNSGFNQDYSGKRMH